jgi:hypothetical protein
MTQIQIPTPPVDRQNSLLHGQDRDPSPPLGPEPKDDFGPPTVDPHGDGDGGKD